MAHRCPGGCGQLVPDGQLACAQDWFRLPKWMQDAVWNAYGRNENAHELAVAAASRWYKANPRRAA